MTKLYNKGNSGLWINVRQQALIMMNIEDKLELSPGEKKNFRIVHTAKCIIVKFEDCKGSTAQHFCKLCLFPEQRDNMHLSMP